MSNATIDGKKRTQRFGVLKCLFIASILGGVGCQGKPVPSVSSPREESLNEAKSKAERIKEGMTLNQVLSELDSRDYTEIPLVEHGGIWFQFKVNKDYLIQVRFSKNGSEKFDSLSSVNLPSQVKPTK